MLDADGQELFYNPCSKNPTAEMFVFFEQALNEKYERDFGKPMYWLIEGAFLVCPKCHDSHVKDIWKVSNRCCPYCGQRLLLPEEINHE
jgi:hypothetical protein